MKLEEIEELYDNEVPIVYKKKKYYIVGINSLNNTVTLKPASAIGLILSGRIKGGIPFDEIEL